MRYGLQGCQPVEEGGHGLGSPRDSAGARLLRAHVTMGTAVQVVITTHALQQHNHHEEHGY